MTPSDRSFRHPDGRQIAYAEWGDRAGAPVVYCHGFPGSRLEARLGDAAARSLGIRLIAPDRPGFGGSTPLPGRRLTDWPQDLEALADELGLASFRLIGVSGGGPYAIAGSLGLGARITGTAIVCGLGEFSARNPTDGMNAAAAASIRLCLKTPTFARWAYLRVIGPILKRYPELAFRILLGSSTGADREVLADTYVRKTIVASFTEAFRNGAAGPTQELLLLTQPWDIDPRRVDIPVQLWHGEADRTVPVAMGRRHAALLPNVDAHFLPGEGHFSLIVRHMSRILGDLIDATT